MSGTWRADWYEEIKTEYFGTETPEELYVVGYGSLLITKEIRDTFPNLSNEPRPVKVPDFRRGFNIDTAPLYDTVPDHGTAVLNVIESESDWFNGVLLGPISQEGLMNYAEREFGYQLTVLDRSSIETYYSDGSELIDSDARIYTCTVKVPEFVEPGLDPLPSYYERCLEGASEWGEEFLRDFKKTTYASGGNLLDFNPQK